MAKTNQPLTLAAVGCGSRARTYCKIAASLDGRYSVVAGADPVPERRGAMRGISNNPDFRAFASADELLAEDRLADVLIIGTQDDYHFEPAKKALEKGVNEQLGDLLNANFDLRASIMDISKANREMARSPGQHQRGIRRHIRQHGDGFLAGG